MPSGRMAQAMERSADGGGMQPQSVNLTDRIPWQWYVVGAVVPVVGQLVGMVAGIVFMARSKIGPALALWATCWLAAGAWGGVITGVVLSSAASDASEATQALDRPSKGFGAETASSPVGSDPSPASEAGTSADAVAQAATTSGGDTTPVADAPADLRSCGNLKVNSATTCAFAQNVFWEYWTALNTNGDAGTISAYSEQAHAWFELTCDDTGTVVCATDQGGLVSIPASALAGYDQSMADAYARTHAVGGE